MNRGRRREEIFLSRHDYDTFIKVLQETSEGWNLKISAYCLMSNHYHLLVHTPDGNISRCMRHINGVYTQRFNRHHKKDGQLFRGRYKAVLVDADSHLLEVLRYIHRNPLRAGIAKNLNAFTWSSHQAYISKAKKWEWLHKDFLLAMLSIKKSKWRTAYIDFVGQADFSFARNGLAIIHLNRGGGLSVLKTCIHSRECVYCVCCLQVLLDMEESH